MGDILAAAAILCVLACAVEAPAAAAEASAATADPPAKAPFINTWLVLGPFEGGAGPSGTGDLAADPREGTVAAGEAWRLFDDRLFSRNYDDYQDLFSYFRTRRGESIGAVRVYAHVYVHSARAQGAELRAGADSAFRAWVNGAPVALETKGIGVRDAVKAAVSLRAGSNRLLLEVSNSAEGRLGFYARLCDPEGRGLPGLTYSANGPEGPLAVSTKAPEGLGTADLPVAYREWPYVGADATAMHDADRQPPLRKPELAMQASPFVLMAQGGAPPYRWSVAQGSLPAGLSLRADGTLSGTVSARAPLKEYRFTVRVTDAAGHAAPRPLRLSVKERPNRWFEEARLTALIHAPESMPEGEIDRFAALMRRQGYGIGMVISYNNGEFRYRWPSRFEPDNPVGDVVGRYKAALENADLKFGMYLGNLNGPNHGGEDGALLLFEEVMRRYRPAALWLDWAGWDGFSLDALYSAAKSIDPEVVIVLNGVQTMSNGDWDVIEVEGWGAWGDSIWGVWPFRLDWPKRTAVESWRMLADPSFEYSKDLQPDWQEYLRVQISLIGQGYVANIDHSPTIRHGIGPNGKLATLDDSVVWQCHRQMADWASPPGIPPLHESYTRVNPGPLPDAPWGYNTISLDRTALYLHLLRNGLGKTGKPAGDALTLGPVKRKVQRVTWMNRPSALRFAQKGEGLAIRLDGVAEDPVNTILKVELDGPYPLVEGGPSAIPVRPGNLAGQKPARLLSADGSHPLIPSALSFAHNGVDGDLSTCAQGANEWAWAFQVDLRREHRVRRVVIHFHPRCFATEYKLHLSADGEEWRTVAHVAGCTGGTREHVLEPSRARFVRVQAIKPDAEGQEGVQMAIAELEVYE